MAIKNKKSKTNETLQGVICQLIHCNLTLIILSFYFLASKYNKTSLARYVYHRAPNWF